MDHNVPRAITDGLRARGVKVITVFEDGASELDDTELLDRVADLGRVLFTRDVIYCKKQQNGREVAHLSKALSMLTNCAFQSELRLRVLFSYKPSSLSGPELN